MKKFIRTWPTLVATGLLSASVFASQGESIVFNPATGNYLVTYLDTADGTFHQVTFVPSTKIDPKLKSEFKLVKDDDVQYKYTLISGRDSQQVTRLLIFDPVSSVTTPMPDVPLMPDIPLDSAGQLDVNKVGASAMDMMNTARYFDTPPLWEASMAYSSSRTTFRIGWGPKRFMAGLNPGEQIIVGFKSHDLPGIIQAEVHGYAPHPQGIDGEEMPDEPGDDPFWKQYFSLIWNNFVPRPAAVPAISVATPFDGVSVLKQLKSNVATWPDMKLIDATTATAIDSSLQTAMNDLSSGNNEAAIRTLKSIRSQLNQMLSNGKLDSDRDTPQGKKDTAKGNKDSKAERAEANRKLVEDVLQFDLKYISRALGSDEKEDETEKR
jgi:hypothetical protein